MDKFFTFLLCLFLLTHCQSDSFNANMEADSLFQEEEPLVPPQDDDEKEDLDAKSDDRKIIRTAEFRFQVKDVSVIRVIQDGHITIQTFEKSDDTIANNIADVTWYFEAGNTIEMEFLNTGGTGIGYYQWQPDNPLSRFQMRYLGQAPETIQ